MKKLMMITAILCSLAACRTDMEMDYIPVEPLYVIEGLVSEEKIEVAVSSTRDMKEDNEVAPVENAIVEISGTDGLREILQHTENGIYSSLAAGSPGNTYTMTVKVDGREFVAVSNMKVPGVLAPVTFRYEPEFTDRVMFCSVGIIDPAGSENYYCLRILKNGKALSRSLATDKGHDGGVVPNMLFLRFSWHAEPTAAEIAAGNENRLFRKGDELKIVLETIDRPVYDYLFSMGLSVGSLSNPLTNIRGGALGYFRACPSDAWTTVFDPETMAE